MEFKAVTESLVKTVIDPARWHIALGQLCAFTSTTKALISLRDIKTAQIIIPDTVSQEFSSPLIYGFSEDEVEGFVTDFGEVDPWTKIEQENHPYFPYPVSRFMPIKDLQRSPFWDWLEPQNIDDCIVCEIGNTEDYWAALNLYFKFTDDQMTNTILERVKDMLPILRDVWGAGRALQIAHTTVESLDEALSVMEDPAALLTQDGQIIAVNAAMKAFLAAENIGFAAGERLSLPENLLTGSQANVGAADIARAPRSNFKGQVKTKAHHTNEFANGEARQVVLLSIEPLRAQLLHPTINVWEMGALSQKERALVKLVASDLKFKQAAAEMGVVESRVYQIWHSAKDKLGVRDVHELRQIQRFKSG